MKYDSGGNQSTEVRWYRMMGCCHRLITSDQGIKEDIFCGRFSQDITLKDFNKEHAVPGNLAWEISATLPIYLPLPINQPPTNDWMDHYMMISIRSIVWWERSQVFQLTHKSIEEWYNLSIQSTRFQLTRGRCKRRTIFSARCHKMSCRTSFRRVFM